MRLLLSRFIIDAVSFFFSQYPKVTIFYTYYDPSTRTTVNVYVTFNFISKSIESGNLAKFFMTSPCNVLLNIEIPSYAYFNPNVDCNEPSTYAFSTSLPSFVKYGAANATQVVFVVQIRAPPDIT